MSKVSITRSLLDDLATSISEKSGESVPMTLTELKDAVDSIQTGGTLQTITKSYTPTESQQTETITAGSGYDGIEEVDVTVGAISSTYVGSGITRRDSTDLTASGATVSVPSGYYASNASKAVSSGAAGTPTATKGTVSNHQVSITPSVTNTSGYISGGTINGTAVTVSASELVSGTYTIDSSGTKDVTNYASASVPAGTAGTPSASKGAVSNHSVSVTPSVTNTTGWITGSTKTGTAVTITASELASGNKAITENGNNIDVVGYSTVSVNVSGGGGGTSMKTDMVESGTNVASTLSFPSMKGEPTSFYVNIDDNVAVGTPSKIVAIVFDGTNLHGQIVTNTTNAQASYSTDFTKSYSNGTLTITSTNASFVVNAPYFITYTYDGGTIDTKDVQVGSGATSITFTGLNDEPIIWSCIFKSNFGTSNGYQRVMAVGKLVNTSLVGFAMDSSAHVNSNYWTASYNNGSLTITSQGTNAGGYFHQPGYYQLTYAYDDGSSGNYQSKTVTPTTSQQVVEADSGYDALKTVTVNAIPSSYVQPTSTVGATTYRASTSSQTISSGTYHSAAATIAAVSQTNLSADNIKSGTTITISNGQSNLWSVTGTYTGGGTSKNVQVLQSTSRTNSSSLTKVLGDLTVSKTGTYDIYWSGGRSNTSTSYTWGTRLYVDGTGYGTENTTWTNNCQSNHLSNVSLTANQKLSVYARGRTGSYYTFAPMLVIIEA